MLGKPSRRDRKHLDQRGRTAEAVILEIADRGMSVTNGNEAVVGNTELVLKTRLRVEPAGEPSFEVDKRFRYPQMGVPSAGQRLVVRYDPDDHENVDIDFDRAPLVRLGGTGPALDPNALLQSVRDAKAASGGDRQAMAQQLRDALGAQGVVFGAGASGAGDPTIAALERLAALHASGALTDEEFAAQKARVLGGEHG